MSALCRLLTHCLLHGLPGLWALDWTPGNLPSLWSWGGLTEIFLVFETLHERLACGRPQPQPCSVGCCSPAWHTPTPSTRPPGSSPPTWEVPVPSFLLVTSFFQAPQESDGLGCVEPRACSLDYPAVVPRSPGSVVQRERSQTLELLAYCARPNPRESKMNTSGTSWALKDSLAFRVWQSSLGTRGFCLCLK